MQLPSFDSLLSVVKDAIKAAKTKCQHQYVVLAFPNSFPAGRYEIQPKISGAAFLIVHPTGELHCFRQGAADLFRKVRAALLAEG
jgi:hypothetical protein